MAERWLPVVGYEGFYEVSDEGHVRSLDRVLTHKRRDHRSGKSSTVARKYPGCALQPIRKSNDYIVVNLGYGNQHSIHVLMLFAFVGPPNNGQEGLHWDGCKTNNQLDNLRWGTPGENAEDARRHGTLPIGERVGTAKLTVSNVKTIRRQAARGNYKAVADQYGVAKSTIRRAAIGKTWASVPR